MVPETRSLRLVLHGCVLAAAVLGIEQIPDEQAACQFPALLHALLAA